MTKKDHAEKPNESHESAIKPKKASVQKVSQIKRSSNKRIKFADPIAVQKSYDKTASPSGAETETRLVETKSQTNDLSDLKPPLSLVAQLDIAAHKMNARPNAQSSVNEEQSLKSLKSTRSTRSTRTIKSVASIKESSPNPSPTSPTKDK